MADNVIGIEVVAKLAEFEKRMAQIPDIGGKQAKAMAAQMSREIKALDATSRKTAQSAAAAKTGIDAATAAAKRLGDVSGGVGGNVAKLAGFLDLVAPGAGEAARSIADMADVGEVASAASAGLGVSLGSVLAVAGPVAIAIGALSLEYNHYASELAEAERKQKQSMDILADVSALSDDVSAARLKLAIATGEVSAKTGEDIDITEKWMAKAEKANATLRAKAAEIRASIAAEEDAIRTSSGRGEQLLSLRSALAQNSAEQARNTDLATDGALAERGAADAAERRAKAEKAAAAAIKNKSELEAIAKETLAALNAEMDRVNTIAEANAATYQGVLSQLDELEAADRRVLQGAEERAKGEHEAALQELADLRTKALMISDSTAARETIESEYLSASKAENEAYFSTLAALREEEDKKAAESFKARIEAEEKAQAYAMNLAADSLGTLSSIGADIAAKQEQVAAGLQASLEEGSDSMTAKEKAAAELRINQAKKGALVAFRVQQSAAIAQAGVTTALMAINAYNDGLAAGGPAGLILGPVAAGVATAAGVGAIAAIASESPPSFHQGGPIDLAPDEVPITARRKEYMLNPTGRSILGDQGLDRANAGVSSGGDGSILAVSVYKHNRWTDRVKRDAIYAGDPYAREINSLKSVGRRER